MPFLLEMYTVHVNEKKDESTKCPFHTNDTFQFLKNVQDKSTFLQKDTFSREHVFFYKKD